MSKTEKAMLTLMLWTVFGYWFLESPTGRFVSLIIFIIAQAVFFLAGNSKKDDSK